MAFLGAPSRTGALVPMSAGGVPMGFGDGPTPAARAVPAPAPTVAPAPESPVAPFYPSARYVDQNLAPEKTLREDDISALARARRTAEEKGVLPPELARYLLPMAMVEGRSGNYGIKRDTALYASPKNVARFKGMGLNVSDSNPDADVVIAPDERGDKMLRIGENTPMEPARYAPLMAAILADKAAAARTSDPAVVVRRYNGRGRAMETADGRTTPADVDVYWTKVQEADRMLQHPKNKAIADMFAAAYGAR